MAVGQEIVSHGTADNNIYAVMGDRSVFWCAPTTPGVALGDPLNLVFVRCEGASMLPINNVSLLCVPPWKECLRDHTRHATRYQHGVVIGPSILI